MAATTTARKSAAKSKTVDQAAAELPIGVSEGATQEIVTTIDTVSLDAPLGPPRQGANYAKRHIDLQLTEERALILQRLTDGLVANRAELGDGKLVATGADAVRWILDGMVAVTARAPSEASDD
jgi:hypothetical protein